jgi:glycine cleavage system pyridoxal-binding protein P
MLFYSNRFAKRHNSPTLGNETELMVEAVGFKSLDELIDATVPKEIRRKVGWNYGCSHKGFTLYVCASGSFSTGRALESLVGHHSF